MDKAGSAKERVLLAASDLFMEFGFKAVSMRQIAQRLGVRPSAIYYHFPQGKSDLFDAVIDHNMSRQKEHLNRVIASTSGDLSEQLTTIARWFVNQHTVDMMRMLRMDAQHVSADYEDQIVNKITESLTQPIAGVFEVAISRQQVRPVDPFIVAGTFIAALNWIAFVVTAERTNKSKTDLIDQTVSVFLNGVHRPSN